MKYIVALTVTYADGSTETFEGTGRMNLHHTHNQANRSMPPRPQDVNINYVDAYLNIPQTP